jgi:hypothetical protein
MKMKSILILLTVISLLSTSLVEARVCWKEQKLVKNKYNSHEGIWEEFETCGESIPECAGSKYEYGTLKNGLEMRCWKERRFVEVLCNGLNYHCEQDRWEESTVCEPFKHSERDTTDQPKLVVEDDDNDGFFRGKNVIYPPDLNGPETTVRCHYPEKEKEPKRESTLHYVANYPQDYILIVNIDGSTILDALCCVVDEFDKIPPFLSNKQFTSIQEAHDKCKYDTVVVKKKANLIMKILL